jgi:iron complex outermembrane recepter protein
MKPILLLAFLFGSVAATFAQSPSGKILGKVQNAEGQFIASATVSLLTSDAKKLIKTVISDKDGLFTFDKIAEGNYQLSITAIGYAPHKAQGVTVTAESTTDVPAITMEAQPKSLKEVSVASTRPYIEQKLDKMVVNVESSPSNAGATALEVLEKSPGVTVDNDGNISLKGKQGVIVLMDGKQTYLSGADLANVLRNLPAAALDQIEIMTNPSSRYDATGNSGVLNIKTKKNRSVGANGSVSVGTNNGLFERNGKYEMTWKPTISANLNWRKNKVNLFSNLIYNYREGRSELNLTRKYYADGKLLDSLNNVNTYFRFRNNNYTVKFGADYFVNKKTTLGVVLNGFLFAGRPTPTTYTTFSGLNGTVFSRLDSKIRNELAWNNFSANINLRHVFDSAGREFNADVDYAYYKNTSHQMMSTGFFDGNYNRTADSLYLKGYLPSSINIYTAKGDYIHPFKKGARLEAGFKTSYVTSDNLVDYKRLVAGRWRPDSRNNHFIYDENINAAYINYSQQVKKWNMQVGLRAENTNSKGYQVTTNSTVKRNYTNLFPSAFLSYEVDKKNTLTLSASRRVQRPNYQDLNPFTFFLDSLSFRQGNPYLTPQFSNNFELAHTFANKITTTLNYSITNDVISRIVKQQRGTNNEITTFLTSDNLARMKNYGIALNAPIELAKWWNTSTFLNVYHNIYDGTYISMETGQPKVVNLDLAYTSFTINMTNNFTLGKGWLGEISGFYRGRGLHELNVGEPMGQISFGLAKNNLMKGRGSLRINLRDPFGWQQFRGSVRYNNVDEKISNRWDNRMLGATFTYRFGKQASQQARRRSSASQDEQNRVGAGGG